MLQLKFNLQKVQFLLIETTTIPCKRKKLHYAKQNQELASDKYLLLPKQAKINQLNLLKKKQKFEALHKQKQDKKKKQTKSNLQKVHPNSLKLQPFHAEEKTTQYQTKSRTCTTHKLLLPTNTKIN